MQAARETVAVFLGAVSADCISFGQNMTTLNYSLSHAIARMLKAGDGDADEVLITELDHEANRGPWLAL
jgi:selenocysteine lyase/cysteine desulfurase